VPAPSSSGARLLDLGITITKTHREPHLAWRQVQFLNWQGVADGPALPPEPPLDPKGCPAGMVRVAGKYLLDRRGRDDSDEVMLAQNGACSRWRTEDHGLNGLCDRVDPDKWKAIADALPRRDVNVCVDRYEYPNAYGELPLVVVTFAEAEGYCAKEKKRVCSETEWTFACEGEEALPYPYGWERDASVCAIDRFGPGPDKDTFVPRTMPRTAEGIDRSWRGSRSGEMARCTSPFGVSDMTGNVDEWTRTVRRGGYTMIMKGGHWGPARQRCRPQTRGHGPHYVRYDQGFRCCTDG
jgi:formylglycine-generating enzyme required for sulfatase activity